MTASRFVSLASAWLDGLYPAHYTRAGAVFIILLILVYISTRPKSLYDTIPAVGRTGFFSSYLDAIRYVQHGHDFIMEGYAKYHPGIFRIPEITRWHVLVAGTQLTDELRKAPDDVLSFDEAIQDTLATDWTLGTSIRRDPYHIPIVRNQLTRNLGSLLSDVRQEIVLAFDHYIPPTEDWTRIKAHDTSMKIISRTSNRMFVGAPLCRDTEFAALNIKFTIDVVIGAKIISLFPKFLKPIAGRLFTNVPKSIRIALNHLKPIIEDRRRQIEEHGSDYPDKPVDMLSWLIDEARGEERTAENLTRRILTVNFAAIHTTSMSFTNALFQLASRPEYIEPIRQEVEAVIAGEGWTKVALTRMRKLDSFLKESQRIKGLGAISMTRVALKEFTFSDGTRLPKGAFVSAMSTPRHLDEEVYCDAKTFKGFRFSDIREEEGEGTKNQMVATSTDFLAFGHGRHACPGRFFAVNELKSMFAHIVLTYDLKMTVTPRETLFGASIIPDSTAEVWFRRRRA